MLYIGIDPGTHTGLAVWDSDQKKFLELKTCSIVEAIDEVREIARVTADVTVIFEDAKQRKYLPRERSNSEYRGHLMGAGSVKRDCSIWEEALSKSGIRYYAIPPRKGLTKMQAATFRSLTGWKGRTSNHARDAAMLVIGR